MLKSSCLAVAILLAPCAAMAQTSTVDVSGAWQVMGEITAGAAPVKATPLCGFKQAGAQLTGTCEGPRATGPLTGTVAGRHVAWQWRATPRAFVGMNGIAVFDGDLGADGAIHGTWTTTQLPGAKGTFSAQKR